MNESRKKERKEGRKEGRMEEKKEGKGAEETGRKKGFPSKHHFPFSPFHGQTSSEHYLGCTGFSPPMLFTYFLCNSSPFFICVYSFQCKKDNQTHDHVENLLPKFIQGCRFNIFYLDLDKNSTPEHFLEAWPNKEDFAISHFWVDPPCKDIASESIAGVFPWP